MKPRISVVVPAYNRPELLEKAIVAIESQSIGQKNFEVVLVYGRNSGAKKICEAAGKKFSNSRSFACESESPAKKRNIGIGKSIGKIVAFIDDDCVPEKGWLEAIAKTLDADNGIAGVEGLTYTEGKRQLYSNAPVNLDGGLFPTCNMAFRKSVLEKINGFDEAFHFYREDSDMAFRAMDFGEIKFCPDAKVLHPQRKVPLFRPLETVFLLKEDVRLMKKLPEKYWRFLGKAAFRDAVKSLLSWMVLLATIFGFAGNAPLISAFATLGFLAVSLFSVRGQDFSAFELLAFSALSFLRGIAYPFAFAFYWLAVK